MQSFLADLARDLRMAPRSLLRQPRFAALVGVTMAVGIGVTVAIFGYLSYFLWPTIETPEAHRVFALRNQGPDGGELPFSYPDFRDLERELTGVAAELSGHRLLGTSVRSSEGTR